MAKRTKSGLLKKVRGLSKANQDILDDWIEKRWGRSYASKSGYGKNKPR